MSTVFSSSFSLSDLASSTCSRRPFTLPQQIPVPTGEQGGVLAWVLRPDSGSLHQKSIPAKLPKVVWLQLFRLHAALPCSTGPGSSLSLAVVRWGVSKPLALARPNDRGCPTVILRHETKLCRLSKYQCSQALRPRHAYDTGERHVAKSMSQLHAQCLKAPNEPLTRHWRSWKSVASWRRLQ